MNCSKEIEGSNIPFDTHVVPRVDYEKLSGDRVGLSSAKLRERMEQARAKRARVLSRRIFNATVIWDRGAQKFCAIDDARKNLLRPAIQQMRMSARTDHRILKLARTIADEALLKFWRCLIGLDKRSKQSRRISAEIPGSRNKARSLRAHLLHTTPH